MKDFDYKYICTYLGSLTSLTTRVFYKNEQVYRFEMIKFVIDPFELDKNEILKIRKSVDYFITKDTFYYLIINKEDYKFVVGPTKFSDKVSDSLYRYIALKLGADNDQAEKIVQALKNTFSYPLSILIQIGCSMNYFFSGEKLSVKDVLEDEALIKNEHEYYSKKEERGEVSIHNTLDLEEKYCTIIENGDLEGMNELISSPIGVRPGVLSDDQMRQERNVFIVTATLASRSAIKGGLDVNVALMMSDNFIQRSEGARSLSEITSIQKEMFLQYTQKVNDIRYLNKTFSPLLNKINHYIEKNLSNNITIPDLVEELYISKAVLCKKVKDESGLTVNEYINSYKINKAKKLLEESDYSIIALADYLGYSSQSTFSKIFKKYTNKSPLQYRKEIYKNR